MPSSQFEHNDTVWPVHIEVRVSASAKTRLDTIRKLVHSHLTSSLDRLALPSVIDGWEDVPGLSNVVERIVASESSCPYPSLPIHQAALQIYVYQPSATDPFEELANMSNATGAHAEDVVTAIVCELPSRIWEGLWESLIYPDDIKINLLNYIYATVVFSDADVDFNIVSWNRVVLLHGPPGTGKTSLCRALAQKLSIRLSHRYSHTRLIEINSHSLFSRWFSESGKLVQKLFANVTEMIEDEDTFVVVLIDEVESLTAARGAMSGNEPSDALRVVNALLTQLDKLKQKKNVLVMSTSNLAKAIDSAFVDRADIVQFIDLPPHEAVFGILSTCLTELMSRGIVAPTDIPQFPQAEVYFRTASIPAVDALMDRTAQTHEQSTRVGARLYNLADRCKGLSGRSLRRLPVLAHARHLSSHMGSMLPVGIPDIKSSRNGARKTSTKPNGVTGAVRGTHIPVDVWLDAMEKVVNTEFSDRGKTHG